MPPFGALHHVELHAIDLGDALAEWGWLLTSLEHTEHQRWPDGASWMRGDTYVVVARASRQTSHDRRGAGLNHLALHAGSRAEVDRLWREAEAHGWRRLSDDRYRWRLDGDAESAFLESSERMKVELVVSEPVAGPASEAGTEMDTDAVTETSTGEGIETRHLGVVIRRDPRQVTSFARDDAHLPEWAAGLAAGELRRDGEDLVMPSPMGEVRVRFAPANEFGVLDHVVTLPDGTVVHNALRVLAHPQGAEVVFTLRRLDGVTAAAFEADARAVTADLHRLRTLLEP